MQALSTSRPTSAGTCPGPDARIAAAAERRTGLQGLVQDLDPLLKQQQGKAACLPVPLLQPQGGQAQNGDVPVQSRTVQLLPGPGEAPGGGQEAVQLLGGDKDGMHIRSHAASLEDSG